ncbi:MAG: hypothetical protein V2I97_19485 [Desulfococcaceae bacterium]|jgi:hypothetical protein|nr:hypothetical protein [Desulfococcaceae bacterium]
MNPYQLFKDIIDILTPAEVFRLLLENTELSPTDLACTIYEVRGICPFCRDTGRVKNKKCPVCSGKAEEYLKFRHNRAGRYREVLNTVPKLWNDFIYGDDVKTEKSAGGQK